MSLEINSCELESCPYCGSTGIEQSEMNLDTGGRKVTCLECGKYWHEGFVFTTIYIPDDYKLAYFERVFILKNCICGTERGEYSYCPVHSEAMHK